MILQYNSLFPRHLDTILEKHSGHDHAHSGWANTCRVASFIPSIDYNKNKNQKKRSLSQFRRVPYNWALVRLSFLESPRVPNFWL